MSNHLKVIGDAFALCNDEDHVIGVVCKTNDEQWGFMPLVKGDSSGHTYVPLQYALEAALKFKAD